ncbi:MAG: ATP-binding cassette domain-containing protein [Bacteroidales bacterium]|nr:ATP-binding cassette domain-containing protein [Candidatus Cacconaster merdequi]
MEQRIRPIVEFRNADVSNGEIAVVENLNLEIFPGEFVYLTGKVGSGKTTIIRTIIGENPLAGGYGRVGNFELSGLRLKQIPFLRRSVGVVFQDFQLLMDRSIEENMEFVLKATGWRSGERMQRRIFQALKLVGLASKGHKMPHQFSGGEQQRAVIARALLNEPKLILADEPTGNLDDETAHGIMKLLFDINRAGTAIIMVTHNQSILKDYPARVLTVADGTCK